MVATEEQYFIDVYNMNRLLATWDTFMLSKIPNNLYTSCFHYLRHIPDALTKLGPMRAYSTRSCERTIGLYSRIIQSKVAPGQNAANEMVKMAATRHFLKHYVPTENASEEENDPRSYVARDGPEDVELWDVINNDGTPIDDFDSLYNVDIRSPLEAYWSRVLPNAQPTEDFKQDVVVGKRLFESGNVYDCAFHVSKRSKKASTLVKVKLPVDKHAFQSRTPVLEWCTFFAQALLFFCHESNGKWI